MSERKDASKPVHPRPKDPLRSPERKLGIGGREIEEDFETDALLDSLLQESVPGSSAPPPAPKPPQGSSPRGPKLHEPAQRLYSQDDVTVVGQELEQLLASTVGDSMPPTAPPSPPSTAPAPGTEATLVGKELEELVARSARPESVAPSEIAPPKATTTTPARPASPPRPAAVPRPRMTPAPARPDPKRAPSQSSPVVTSAPSLATLGTGKEDSEDEETRILHVASELETQEPTVRLPASSGPPRGRLDLSPESFVPPAGIGPESFGPTHAAPTPMPLEPETRRPAAPPVHGRDRRSDLGSEAPTGHPPPLDPRSLRLPPLPALDRTRIEGTDALDGGEAHLGIDALAGGFSHETWEARAEWLESEAQRMTDPAARARALMVASELFALADNLPRARDVAAEAATSGRSLPMVAKQQRWLAAADRDFPSVAAALDAESRSASTADARAHAAYFSAEVHRLALDDLDAAKKKYDAAVRAAPHDVRPHLMKLCDQLAGGASSSRVKIPEHEELTSLSRAAEELAFLRGATAGAAPGNLDAFDQARRALARGDRAAAAQAILRLGRIEGLGPAAHWLAAALLGHEDATRARALELLESLLSVGDGNSARRALAARALELGDTVALSRAIADDSGTFSAADRVALHALVANDLGGGDPLVRDLATTDAGRPLATAAVLASAPMDDEELAAGSSLARTALALGRRIARGGSTDLLWMRPALGAFAEADPTHALVRALNLELAVALGSAQSVAANLDEWPRLDHNPAAQRDRELLAALVHEIGGATDQARAAYERALVADPACEAAARALAAYGTPTDAAETLERLGEAETSDTHSALHFLEAALRGGTDDPAAFDALLEKAVEAAPRLVLPYRVGEHAARQRGDAERLLGWLRARREAVTDPLERALDLVREALLVAESDLEAAAALLRDAHELRPTDLAISELYERVTPTPELSRATVREAAAERAAGVSRRRLLLDACLEYERASDQQSAIRCVRAAIEGRGDELSRWMHARLVLGTPESTRLAEELIARAKATNDAAAQRELYEQLSELDAARGNTSSALLWQAAILERSPKQLSALRQLEHAYVHGDRRDDLEPILAALAEVLPGPDAAAAARVAARLRLAAGNWAATRKVAELGVQADPNALWALRMLSAHARVADDDETSQAVERRLFELSARPMDKATLALRAAEAAARSQRWDDAQALLEHALDQSPDHLVALTLLADVLEIRGDFVAAARAMETVAEASRVPAHKVAVWYHASLLWLDHVNDADRGRAALEQAVALDLGHDEAVARLQALYVARGDRQRLAELLEKRLERTTDPEERIAIEVARGRALAEIGEPAAAKAALAAALDANPDHYEALEAFADLCLSEGDWVGAEQAFIRLARHAPDAERQAQIYGKLGELYDVALPNPERAELAYQEVLKRTPEDVATVDRLVAVYGRLGTPEKAVALAQQFLERAATPEHRRERTVRLASVLEQIAGNRKQAETTLEKARREWPHDASVLRALAEFYGRAGEHRSAQMLLDRSAMDARRALATGRFEPALFETLATVADLRGAPDGAAVAHATLAALAGDEMPVRGAGYQAAQNHLDDLVAPEVLSGALRALLHHTGALLDRAYPLETRSLRAAPLPGSHAQLLDRIREMAQPFGLTDVQVLVSPGLGAACVPGGSAPATLLLGQALVDTPDEPAQHYLLLRAMTVLKARGSALARTAPIDLGAIVGGLLSLFVPTYAPQGVDPRKLVEARARLQEKNTDALPHEVTTLAHEVSGTVGNRTSQLATALYQWGNRTALLATGDPLVALRALALAAGSAAGPPVAGPERVRWIVRNAEARDLMIFSVSEHYLEARKKVGV